MTKKFRIAKYGSACTLWVVAVVTGLFMLFSAQTYALTVADSPPPGPPPSMSSTVRPAHRFPKRWIKKLPIPPFLAIVLHHARTLNLSTRQWQQLNAWKSRHRSEHRMLMHRLRHDRVALRRAILAGRGPEIGPLLSRFNRDVVRVEHFSITADEFVERVLTPPQWHRLVHIIGCPE